jgi:heme/copper-type cytochrome/quinol oxidase subunit 1
VRRALWSRRVATVQAYLYGGGLLWMILAMSWAGVEAVPRRTADVSYGGAAPGGWDLPMNLVGIGAGLAGIAGFLFVLNMVLTLLAGRRTEEPEQLVPAGVWA